MESERQLRLLGTLLQLERQARQADSPEALAFLAVNESHRVSPCQQALFWRGGPRAFEVVAASGVGTTDPDAPYLQWFRSLAAALPDTPRTPHRIDPEQIDPALRRGWDEWSPGHLLWCPLDTGCGLALLRATPWQDPELLLLETLVEAYAHAWRCLSGHRRVGARAIPARRAWLLAGLLLIPALALIQVPLSALAPARIAPLRPTLVSAPMEGVIESLHVTPNQMVTRDQPLFSLDARELENRHQLAQRAEQVAQAEFRRYQQRALTDEQSQECRYLVKDFGTSQSPKSTRQRDSRYCPDRPALITTPSRT
ncbi:MAG: hypothetical protein C3L24_02495, partial [Candidatus Sedimenticola endophacoides]